MPCPEGSLVVRGGRSPDTVTAAEFWLSANPAVPRPFRWWRRQAPGFAGSLVDSCPPTPIDTLRDTEGVRSAPAKELIE